MMLIMDCDICNKAIAFNLEDCKDKSGMCDVYIALKEHHLAVCDRCHNEVTHIHQNRVLQRLYGVNIDEIIELKGE